MKTLIYAFAALILMSFTYNGLKNSKDDFQRKSVKSEIVEQKFYKPKVSNSQALYKNLLKSKGIINGNLVAHSNFFFLEYLDLDESDFEKMKEITKKYPGETFYLQVYELEDADLESKYSKVLNQELQLNNYDRKRYPAKVIDIVIVNDAYNEPPYLAAVLDNHREKDIYYGWMGKVSKKTYPFTKMEFGEGLIEEMILLSKEMGDYIEFELDEETDYEYRSDRVFKFQNGKGEEYIVIQNCLVGGCETLIASDLMIYKKGIDGLILISRGYTDKYVIDLIDIEGDGYPEILIGSYASSAILDISKPKLSVKSSFGWSIEGCPC
jgi:hypothetical protein